MKIAIIYATMTGHSKKIAEAVAAELKLEAYNIKNKPVIENIDILFIAGGIYSHKSMPKMIEFLKGLDSKNVKKVALITSSAAGDDTQKTVREILTEKNIKVLTEEYVCLGNFLFIKSGHPNKTEILNAIDFAKRIIEKEKVTA